MPLNPRPAGVSFNLASLETALRTYQERVGAFDDDGVYPTVALTIEGVPMNGQITNVTFDCIATPVAAILSVPEDNRVVNVVVSYDPDEGWKAEQYCLITSLNGRIVPTAYGQIEED